MNSHQELIQVYFIWIIEVNHLSARCASSVASVFCKANQTPNTQIIVIPCTVIEINFWSKSHEYINMNDSWFVLNSNTPTEVRKSNESHTMMLSYKVLLALTGAYTRNWYNQTDIVIVIVNVLILVKYLTS